VLPDTEENVMSGLVINGKAEDAPGLDTQNYLDNPTLVIKAPEDGRPRRTKWVRGICLHTSKGIPGGRDLRPQKLLPGLGPSTNAGERMALYCLRNPDVGRSRHGGHHLTIDFDGRVYCHSDLARLAMYHGHFVNEVSIGIEIYQGSGAQLYEGQLDVAVLLCDFLTRRFGIQRQFHWPYRNAPIRRLGPGANGRSVVGVYGHRDVTAQRGFGDPGNLVFERLRAAGYEAFDFGKGEDIAVWKDRQRGLGFGGRDVDGIPGPKTRAALAAAGHAHGLWVARPAD
jgi:hypothetical protein